MAGSDATTVSAYDLLPEDEREALAWVREHGGLGAVEKRLMPAGMEWPKHTDGELVRIGGCWGEDGCDTSITYIERIIFAEDGVYLDNEYNEAFYRHGERVKRPAPKVLDADGAEIRVGDVLYSVETGDSVIVDSIEPGNPWFATTDGALQHCAKFTHRAPVLAADGRPLEVGQTVWLLDDDGRAKCECEVISTSENIGEFSVMVKEAGKYGCSYVRPSRLTHSGPVLAADGEPLEVGQTVWSTNYGAEYVVCKVGQHSVTVEFWHEGIATHGVIAPSHLTHERPDTWERLEEDVTLSVERYRELYGIKKNDGMTWPQLVRKDLVRRAKALAERGA